MSQCLQVNDSPHGPVLASHLTSVAAKDNFSSTVEVRVRQPYAQWRYRLDVLVDGRPTYFDRYPQKVQHFQGVTVYTPSNILNQSHVVIMFQVQIKTFWKHFAKSIPSHILNMEN